jgi:hypothetical protein
MKDDRKPNAGPQNSLEVQRPLKLLLLLATQQVSPEEKHCFLGTGSLGCVIFTGVLVRPEKIFDTG